MVILLHNHNLFCFFYLPERQFSKMSHFIDSEAEESEDEEEEYNDKEKKKLKKLKSSQVVDSSEEEEDGKIEILKIAVLYINEFLCTVLAFVL